MGLTKASFGGLCKVLRGQLCEVDDLHFVEQMLSSYNLSSLCDHGGYEAVRLYCQRAFLMIRFSSNYAGSAVETKKQLNALEQIVAEMQPYCFYNLKSDYATTTTNYGGGDSSLLPSANILNLLIDHFPSVLICCKPSFICSHKITFKLLSNAEEECRIAYRHPLMQEYVWYPLLMQRHYDLVSHKLSFYIEHPHLDPSFSKNYYNDFPLAFWERFCMQYADELTNLYHCTLSPTWQQQRGSYNNNKKTTPFLDFLMRHVWLPTSSSSEPTDRESPFLDQFCEHLLSIVREQLDAYFADPAPLLPSSHLYYLVRLMEHQNFLMILDTSAHEFSWPMDDNDAAAPRHPHHHVLTYFCKDAQHKHFLTQNYGSDY
jgi:hypothetical protein